MARNIIEPSFPPPCAQCSHHMHRRGRQRVLYMPLPLLPSQDLHYRSGSPGCLNMACAMCCIHARVPARVVASTLGLSYSRAVALTRAVALILELSCSLSMLSGFITMLGSSVLWPGGRKRNCPSINKHLPHGILTWCLLAY